MAHLKCIETFADMSGPAPRIVALGEIVDSKDPVVKGREALFTAVRPSRPVTSQRIEQATAAPGELREVTKIEDAGA
ncbi:MAG: hypothetical protein AB7G37_20830, partial [Solirubrobacteraceae bacterium]